MEQIEKFILRRVEVDDYREVEVEIEEATSCPVFILLKYRKTNELIEVLSIPIEKWKYLLRGARLESLLSGNRLSDRSLYFYTKQYYRDFDDIYDSMLLTEIC